VDEAGICEWDGLVFIQYYSDRIVLSQYNQIKPLQILHAVASL
jgi:hypothetical protein